MTSAQQQRAKKSLRAAARRHFGDDVGCHDGGCVYGHPGGMHTNGGCRCLDDVDPNGLRLHARRLSFLAQHLAAGTEDA